MPRRRDGPYQRRRLHATVAGESLGSPTLKATDGATVKNLLYTFEGCFDVT
jgi:hypothetical protein